MKKRFYSTLMLFCIAVSNSVLHADIVTYPDLESTQMLFTNVTESSVGEILPLFGSPAVSGNSLVFDNPGFEASSFGSELEFIDGRMTTTVTAKNNNSIFSVTLSEYGTFQNSGADSNVAVNAIGFAIADGQIYQGSFSFQNNTEGTGKWAESFVIEFDNPVSSFSFVADNQLFAGSGTGSSSFVNKEGVKLTINSVPEPSVGIFGSLALAGTLFRRRR